MLTDLGRELWIYVTGWVFQALYAMGSHRAAVFWMRLEYDAIAKRSWRQVMRMERRKKLLRKEARH
jgi:hypothetical protein